MIQQRKQVTVLFIQVTGLSAVAETMGTAEADALWGRLETAIHEHGGQANRPTGDTTLAVFGAPTARQDDSERAMRAALALRAVIAAQSGTTLRLRIGINTGVVLYSAIGISGGFMAVGEVVNAASSLLRTVPRGDILVTHETYRHVRGVFTVEPLQPVTLTAKGEAIPIYWLKQAKPRAFRITEEVVEGVATRMIGRDRELRQMQQALRTAVGSSRTQSLTIIGEAGIGKSRLLHEFHQWMELLPEEFWLFQGRADEQTSRLPYALVRDMLAFRFEILDSDPPAVAREKLEQGIVEMMGEEEANQEKAHFIGHLIGFDFSSSPYLQGILGDARQIRDRAVYYLSQFFTALTPTGPSLIYLEDMQWADDGSLDFIDYLVRTANRLPLLVICLARPELLLRRPEWGRGWSDHTHLELNPLSEMESRQFVADILRRVPEIPAQLLDLLAGRAEGNPFFIEELVRLLVEDGVVVTGERAWQVHTDRLAAVQIPSTLTGLMQASLDGLEPQEREVLQRAAVVGRVFWDSAVAYLQSESLSDVALAGAQHILDVLQASEFIVRRDDTTFAGAQEYRFKHTMMQEYTYESVLRRLRPEYHARAAAWLIQHSGERVSQYAGLIGEHYERAEMGERATEWYSRAARQAQDTYASAVAINYYQKALSLLPPHEAYARQRLALYEGMGQVLQWQAHHREAMEVLRAMGEAAEAAGDKAAQVRAYHLLAWVQDGTGDYREALANAGRGVEIGRLVTPASPDYDAVQAELATAIYRRGWSYFRMGQAEAAIEVGEQVLELTTRLDLPRERAFSLNLLGVVHALLGNYDRSDDYKQQALLLRRDLGDQRGVASMLGNMGETARVRGDYETAVQRYNESLVISREIGDRSSELLGVSNRGGAFVGLGQYDAAEEDLRYVINQAQTFNFLPETYRFLAQCYLGQGRVAEAWAAARTALAGGRQTGDPEILAGAWGALGEVAARSDWRTAPADLDQDENLKSKIQNHQLDPAACFAESVRLHQEIGAEAGRARSLRAWAQYEMEQGDAEHGRAMWQEAREIFGRLDMDHELARMNQENVH
jgi:class 3 adenylate cyclase/tetratricopeptide (TPR) repeat protein